MTHAASHDPTVTYVHSQSRVRRAHMNRIEPPERFCISRPSLTRHTTAVRPTVTDRRRQLRDWWNRPSLKKPYPDIYRTIHSTDLYMYYAASGSKSACVPSWLLSCSSTVPGRARRCCIISRERADEPLTPEIPGPSLTTGKLREQYPCEGMCRVSAMCIICG
ncbi:hypothetical protein BC628DRAFT_944931 [Trametes gibbosa]|nr:hypothetical protein BC628DRAFT_944931 [Trametes gibbosa]